MAVKFSTAIGIDFGGTSIKSALVRDGQILRRGEPIDTQLHRTPDAILAALLAVISGLRADAPAAAIGIGLPGLIDSVHGIVHELTNVEGWVDVPLRALMCDRTGLPVTIENDANAMAYGEWKHGAARDGTHVICLTLGTGVGGGLILDGRLYRGAQLGAGEIGHMSIDYRGRRGVYGNLGCLEKYIGNGQIAERAVERYREAGLERSLAQCTPLELDRAAHAGDAVAVQLWDDLGVELGTALASVVWLLNPDTIVIGGGVAKAGELILEPVRRTIRSATIEIIHRDLRIVPAELGNDAGIIGNAALALESLPAL